MALSTVTVSASGTAKNLLAAIDGSGNLAVAHVLVDGSGVERGSTTNPLTVTVTNPSSSSTASTVSLATSTAAIGTVGVTGTVAVSGTFYPATQPVSFGALPAGTNTIGAVTGSGTFAVSATALPLPAGAATEASLVAVSAKLGGTLTTQSAAATSINTGQPTIGTSPTLIVAARSGRRSVLITQMGTTQIFLGNGDVQPGFGFPLAGVQYATMTIEGGAAVYACTASGSQQVAFLEVF